MSLSSLKAVAIEFINTLSLAILLSIFAQQACVADDESPTQSPVMEVAVFYNLISVELVDAALVDVFQAIEKKAGFKVHLSGNFDDRLTMSLTNVPLDRGLKRLAGKHSLSLLYGQTPRRPGQDGTKNITEAWVYSRQSSSSIPNGANALQAMTSSASQQNAISPKLESSTTYTDGGQGNILPSQQPTINELVQRGDSTAVMAMAAYLGHEDKDFRRKVVHGISAVQGAGSTKVLGQVLRGETDTEIRMIAVRALAARQDDMVAHTFLTEALSDPDQDVQALAYQLLNQ